MVSMVAYALPPWGIAQVPSYTTPCCFHTIWHLMLFGSERQLLLTVKNLLIAPGGP
jgi:hypothetical protein